MNQRFCSSQTQMVLRTSRAPLCTQRSEAHANLFCKEFRLFPGRKVPAFRKLVVMDQFGKSLLRPAPRSWIEFVRKYADGNRDGDALDIEIPEFAPVLPIETGARKRRVRQPGDRDVVEDVVAREAFGFSLKDAGDQRVAAHVVIKEISRQTDGGIRQPSQRLR